MNIKVLVGAIIALFGAVIVGFVVNGLTGAFFALGAYLFLAGLCAVIDEAGKK